MPCSQRLNGLLLSFMIYEGCNLLGELVGN